MQNFEERLNQARTGKAILFCGAGFTANCLNFEEHVEIGTGSQLLDLINSALKDRGHESRFQNVKNAADTYEEIAGENGLMNLLKARYQIQCVSDDMSEIMNFPWNAVYTTNYDTGIEISARSAGRSFSSINNLDRPTDLGDGLNIIHLHGCIDSWDIRNFKQSCILGSESYLRLDGVSDWLSKFRQDVERAELIVFVGFNADDFHLNQAIFDLTGLKKKIFFINRPTSEPDPDINATQKRFGTPMFIGRTDFAKKIRKVLEQEKPEEPALASFRRYSAPLPSDGVPKVKDIEDLFLFGKFNASHMARDVSNGRSDYHVLKPISHEISNFIVDRKNLLLITGEICEGKTIAVENISFDLSKSNPVFRLQHIYDDILDEVSRILNSYPNAILIIENCFDFREDKLMAIARLCQGSDGALIMTSRNIAAEAESHSLSKLQSLEGFMKTAIQPMQDDEISNLIDLVDQIAGWRNLEAPSHNRKISFITRTCGGSFPAFLLRLLKSQYVKERYLEEYNKVNSFNETDRMGIIAALYIAHVGHVAPVSFLSNALSYDIGSAIDKLTNQADPFRIVHRDGESIRAVPAIGATNILEHMIPDRDIVDSVVYILEYLAEQDNRDEFERYIYTQMMRYSILRSVVSNTVEIERFFDNISKNGYFRKQVLFWLQWHMAKLDLGQFVAAENFLDQSYLEADEYEKRSGKTYNRTQLDDRKAKFLMSRARHVKRDTGGLFRDFKESTQVTSRILRNAETTHHPYQTLEEISKTYTELSHKLMDNQQQVCKTSILELQRLAEQRLDNVPEGYQRSTALAAFKVSKSLMENSPN